MKRRTMTGTAIGMAAALALSGGALAFTGVVNGSFEDGVYSGGAGRHTLTAGATALTGWTIAGSVGWIGTYWQPADGSKSIDVNGDAAGSISQSFATTVGKTYVVRFRLSGDPGSAGVKTLTVAATGTASANYTFDTTVIGNTLADMKWQSKTYSFVATVASTTLTFSSPTAGVFGPALDRVSVTEAGKGGGIKAAKSGAICKLGGWTTLRDGAGNMFKNQGDCVSYHATGGKNLGSLRP